MKIPKKAIIWIIIAVIFIVMVVYIIILKRKKAINGDSNKIDDISVDSNDMTIDDNQANVIVQNILEAMDRNGTDEETIISNLSGLNQSDLLYIIKKFGLKYYTGTMLANGWLSEKMSRELNLISWLKAELSGKSLETVKTIFTSNNISF